MPVCVSNQKLQEMIDYANDCGYLASEAHKPDVQSALAELRRLRLYVQTLQLEIEKLKQGHVIQPAEIVDLKSTK